MAPLVLLVDDSIPVLDVYAEALADERFRVHVAHDGAEALTQVRTARPDVIVMDYAMPGMDGLEVTRRLKADPRTRDIPVILFTGDQLGDRPADVGCDDVITKPCRIGVLVAAIRAQLRRGPY